MTVAVAWCRRILKARWTRVTVVGQSMSPTLRHGQSLMMRKVDSSYSPRKSDLVAFQNPVLHSKPRLLIKRVVRVGRDGSVWVSGDARRSIGSQQFGWIPPVAVEAFCRRHLLSRARATRPGSPVVR